MIAILSTLAYSAQGPITLQLTNDSSIRDLSLRISRTATLDGRCAITNGGMSHSDRTLQLQAINCSPDTATQLWALVQQATAVCLAARDESFQGYLSSYRERGANVQLTFLVERKLSA